MKRLIYRYYDYDGSINWTYAPSISIIQISDSAVVETWVMTYNATLKAYIYDFEDYIESIEYLADLDFWVTAIVRYASMSFGGAGAIDSGTLVGDIATRITEDHWVWYYNRISWGWIGEIRMKEILDEKLKGIERESSKEEYLTKEDAEKLFSNIVENIFKIKNDLYSKIESIEMIPPEVIVKEIKKEPQVIIRETEKIVNLANELDNLKNDIISNLPKNSVTTIDYSIIIDNLKLVQDWIIRYLSLMDTKSDKVTNKLLSTISDIDKFINK